MTSIIDKGLATCSKFSIAAGGIIILAIAIVGALDTVMSAALNFPLPAAHTFAEKSLPAAVMLSVGWVIRSNANINVDIVTNTMGPRGRRVVSFVSATCSVLFFFGFSYGAWKLAIESVHLKEVAVAAVEFPVWPLNLGFAIGSTIAFLETISLFFRHVFGKTNRLVADQARDSYSEKDK